MAQFLNHHNIKKEFIFLVSPFIKLNDEMKYALSRKKNDVNFEIVVLFGKYYKEASNFKKELY